VRAILARCAMRHAAAGGKAAADRLHKEIAVRSPKVLGHDACAVATYIDGRRNFKGPGHRVGQLHKHLQGDAGHLSASSIRATDSLKCARVSTDILMPGLPSALCNWPRRVINPCRDSVWASSGTPESRRTMPTILRKCARCNDLR